MVCVLGVGSSVRERSPCPRPCSLSGMLSAWGSGLPPDSRRMGRQILSRLESLPPHPKGRPLVCLVETPGRGGGGGQQEQQSPHHCPGGAFLREGGGMTRGTRTTPTSSASPALPASPMAFTRAASGGTGRNISVLKDRVSASWNPLQSVPRLRGGDALSTTQVGALPSPCRFWELGRKREAWSQSWLLPHLPASAHP